jgi:hypothetical protein
MSQKIQTSQYLSTIINSAKSKCNADILSRFNSRIDDLYIEHKLDNVSKISDEDESSYITEIKKRLTKNGFDNLNFIALKQEAKDAFIVDSSDVQLTSILEEIYQPYSNLGSIEKSLLISGLYVEEKQQKKMAFRCVGKRIFGSNANFTTDYLTTKISFKFDKVPTYIYLVRRWRVIKEYDPALTLEINDVLPAGTKFDIKTDGNVHVCLEFLLYNDLRFENCINGVYADPCILFEISGKTYLGSGECIKL